jgi:putative endonuclease
VRSLGPSVTVTLCRHARAARRASPGHPRLAAGKWRDVGGRDKPGRDELISFWVVAKQAAGVDTLLMEGGWIYILTNRPNGTLYIGVTSDLARRAWEHREAVVDGFTKRYGLKRLVYVERYEDIRAAIQREKNMKHWPRRWKVGLILRDNPEWNDPL